MIVVLDTNVFVRDTHLLRKKGGPALLQFLRAIQGRLYIPEILSREYMEQTLATVRERWREIHNALDALQTLSGRRYDHQLPQDESVNRDTQQRLHELRSLTLDEPLTDELLAAAGQRSIDKKRPVSKTDHGYKDCLIWECILRLPEGSEVRLVSRDSKGFYDKDRLSDDLFREAQNRQINVVGHKSVEALLQELQERFSLLDSSALEAFEVAEDSSQELSGASSASRSPAVPAAYPMTGRVDPAAVDGISRRLADAQNVFEGIDLKILGFIAHLDTPGKPQLFQLLSEAGISSDIARNVADRLVIGGFVRDTGNHYFVPDRNVRELAASAVEGEIIKLLNESS